MRTAGAPEGGNAERNAEVTETRIGIAAPVGAVAASVAVALDDAGTENGPVCPR